MSGNLSTQPGGGVGSRVNLTTCQRQISTDHLSGLPTARFSNRTMKSKFSDDHPLTLWPPSKTNRWKSTGSAMVWRELFFFAWEQPKMPRLLNGRGFSGVKISPKWGWSAKRVPNGSSFCGYSTFKLLLNWFKTVRVYVHVCMYIWLYTVHVFYKLFTLFKLSTSCIAA